MGFSMNLCSYLPMNITGMDPLLMEQSSGLQPVGTSQGSGGLFFEWETRPAGSSGGGRKRFQEELSRSKNVCASTPSMGYSVKLWSKE